MDFGPMMEGRLAYIKAELGVTERRPQPGTATRTQSKSQATTMEGMHTVMVQTMQSGDALERLDARTKATKHHGRKPQGFAPRN